MIRALARPLIFFAVPFALYALYLAARLINPFALERWTRAIVPLTLVGVILAVGSLVAVGLFVPRHEGRYVPAHIEDGRVVPGRIQ